MVNKDVKKTMIKWINSKKQRREEKYNGKHIFVFLS